MENLQTIIDLIMSLNTLAIVVFFFFSHLYDGDIKSHWLVFVIFNCSIGFIWSCYCFLSSSRSIIDQSRSENYGLFLVEYSIIGVIAFTLYLIMNWFWGEYQNKMNVKDEK